MIGTPAVCKEAGITYRQLDYWIRVGAIVPEGSASGSGTRRSWSDEDVKRLHRLARVVRLFERFSPKKYGVPTRLVEILWRTPIDEPIVIEGDDCQLIIDPTAALLP